MRYLSKLSYIILIPCGEMITSEMSVHIHLGVNYSFSQDLANFFLLCPCIYLNLNIFAYCTFQYIVT
jgi:hypothetical protein